MAEAKDYDEGPGTQPASFDDLGMDSMSTMRPASRGSMSSSAARSASRRSTDVNDI